jgi:hypothetical protein
MKVYQRNAADLLTRELTGVFHYRNQHDHEAITKRDFGDLAVARLLPNLTFSPYYLALVAPSYGTHSNSGEIEPDPFEIELTDHRSQNGVTLNHVLRGETFYPWQFIGRYGKHYPFYRSL